MADPKKPAEPNTPPAKPAAERNPKRIKEGYRPLEDRRGYTPTTQRPGTSNPKPPRGGTGENKGSDKKK